MQGIKSLFYNQYWFRHSSPFCRLKLNTNIEAVLSSTALRSLHHQVAESSRYPPQTTLLSLLAVFSPYKTTRRTVQAMWLLCCLDSWGIAVQFSGGAIYFYPKAWRSGPGLTQSSEGLVPLGYEAGPTTPSLNESRNTWLPIPLPARIQGAMLQ